ncbi:hypothetical protein DFH08DRAFT_759861 [Mycena albidolilacea]|uniref:Uncharacterized protein n=1 Tax=Mycena albidolilacea TaxID=1033008 RepID=A0AAD7E7Q3_9AGAR|nr:hypothetical protein DFH08DRAFT_759861 [Mycena albidolilacea]
MSHSSGGSPELPANIKSQIQVSACVFAGSSAVLVWDILHNLRNDYSLLFEHKVTLASGSYVVSRLASLIYALGLTLFASYPLPACNTAFLAFNSFYPITVTATAFLFFFRVRAIYRASRLATLIFGFLWLSVLATSTTIPISGRAISFGDRPQCIVAHGAAYNGSSGVTITVHDTIVFFAISYRLVSNFAQEDQTRGEKIRGLFSGANLPAFSKALFNEGQMYYMITVVTNVITTAMVYIPTTRPLYRGLLVIPNVAVSSIMACRVYRNTKLGLTHGNMDLVLPTLNPSASESRSIPLSVVHFCPQRTELLSAPDSGSTGGQSGTRDITLKVTDSGFLSAPHDDTEIAP